MTTLRESYSTVMGKKKKGGGAAKGPQQRTRTNPTTGEVETVSGPKAGRKRQRLSLGHPLRTHDLRTPTKTSQKKSK